MRNETKVNAIRPWIDPNEWVTVRFLDEDGLYAEVIGCNAELVGISMETRVPHVTPRISMPLSRIEVSEDLSHYTRDSDGPLKPRRSMLVIDDNRPPVIY